MSVQDMDDETRSRLVDMGWLLNELVGDIKTPVDLAFQLKPAMDASSQNYLSINRLCLTGVLIGLCKLNEIFTHYGIEIRNFPVELRKKMKAVKREIEGRGIYAYRSKYLAHSFSREKDCKPKPLSLSESVQALMKIIDYGLDPVCANVFEFYKWAYEKGNEDSVVNVIYSCVKHIDHIVGGLGKRT